MDMGRYFKSSKKAHVFASGMTLVEMILTMVIVLILALTLFWMLHAGRSMTQASVARGANRQDLQIIASNINEELKDSDVRSLTTIANSPRAKFAFSFLSAYSFFKKGNLETGSFYTYTNGLPVWQKYVIYFIPPDSKPLASDPKIRVYRLIRKEIIASPPPAEPVALVPGILDSYCTEINKENEYYYRRISSSIYSFDLNIGDNTATLNFTVLDESGHGKINQQSREMKIFFLN